ncbi:prepilin peptidase [Vibrio vulnificus]|uniref:Primosomal replication protein n=1 Tax=Vibrio vulnificus TaxID=672 RepID=A0AAW4HDQ4_VIBVL|nr:primosomal replication protein [Vibrio vulnificus]EGR1893537.1 prepilin peptidase [Vibrio vulnificus]EJC6736116.1 primosomal replication protein [Vibrio vulnificus]ELV8766704.1 primosomal replication protein [Vibrio vulnificus]KFK50543.1 prepilin peptidase [Vibrio vulnificus]MBN8122591.1 primosomal replication protein [Vibrio vulnificus]
MKLQDIALRLDELAIQAAQLDRQRGEHHTPLFDERLFAGRARLLVPCVKETKATLDALLREQKDQRLTTQRAEYLTEQLVAQFSAIQRELSTTTIRKNEIKHASHYRKPINVLYQELAQHQEWTRRLKEMVLEKQKELDTAPAFLRTQAQQALLATEQRLERCQAAMLKIENQITYREKNQ